MNFQRTPLAVAVCSAVLCAPVGAASLLDDAAPTVDLYAAPEGYQIEDFEVAALPGGRFAVLWYEADDEDHEIIKLGRFEADGDLLGDVMSLDAGNASSIDVRDPALAADDDGDLVAAWSLALNDDCIAVSYSRIAGDGSLTDEQNYVNAGSGDQCLPAVTMDADGRFLLAWYHEDAAPEYRALAFNADGTAMGDFFVLGEAQNGAPALALQGDTLMAAWSAYVSSAGGDVVLGRRFNLNGTALEAEPFRLDDGSEAGLSLDQRQPALAADEDGGFLAMWSQEVWPDHVKTLTMQGRHWAADGTPGETLAVPTGGLDTGGPSLASDGDGLVVVGWSQALPDENGGESRVMAFRDGAPLDDGAAVVATSTIPEAVDHSLNTEVVLGDGTATVVWFAQEDGGPSTLRARTLSVEDAPGDGGGGGGGGGSTGLLALLALVLFGRRRNRG
nr:GlyGly-CTERM sorting domain-containing protein [Alloalcanivorax marinus]